VITPQPSRALLERVLSVTGWVRIGGDWHRGSEVLKHEALDNPWWHSSAADAYVIGLCEAAEMLLDDARATQAMNSENDAILFRLAEEDRTQASRVLERAGVTIEEWEKTR
jgi:hypothetical protein